MSSHILNFFRPARRYGLARQTRLFRRREDGATAIEFGIVIFPFIAILFAIVEIALVFFAGQVLETAVADSARRIMTGEVQKHDVCSRLQAMFDCQGGVHLDVRTFTSFGSASTSTPVDADGNLDTSTFTFNPGTQNSIVVVRAAYEWPIFVRDFGFNLASLPNGKRLLMATAAFRNEPYKD
jgi:Flp pilus assembly protein TadG